MTSPQPLYPPGAITRRRHLASVRADGPRVRVVVTSRDPAPTQVPVDLPPMVTKLPRVAVVGGFLRIACTGLLSDRWLQVPDSAPADIVVLFSDDPAAVRAERLRRPDAAVLSVTREAGASAGAIVGLLEAGADACVRGAENREVVAHLAAMVRRLSRS